VRLTRILRTTGFRLAAIYAGLFGFSVLVLFGVILWITSDALRQQLAATIESEVAALVEDHRTGGLSHAAEAIGQRLASGPESTNFYLLLDPQGRKIAGNLPALPPRNGWLQLRAPRERDGKHDGERDEDHGDDHEESDRHGLLALGKVLADGSFLLVGQEIHPIVEVEETIVRAYGWAFGVTVLLGGIGGVVLSLGFLRRVDAINRTSRAIIEGKLAERVPTRGTGDELDRLALNLNEMLDRVQVLMESLRHVSNDIAHDLRTPLGRLRQRLETARLRARSLEDYETAVDRAIVDTDAILATFSALLRIAQIESGARNAAFSTVDLSGVFHTIVDAYGAVAEDRGQTLTAAVAPGIAIRGDRELLTQMLANLVENAIRHTPEGSAITVALERGADGPIGIVADTGPGIPPDVREKVFQRFYRLDRSRTTAGSGLGLSLVAAVAETHGIVIALADNKPGLEVRLRFAPPAS
jgi:signal transduction histidine kinase